MKAFYLILNIKHEGYFILKFKKPTLIQINRFNENVKSRGLRGAGLISYKKNLVLTQEQKEVIIGTLLGDSTIRTSKCNYCIKFEQKYTQIDYLNHLHEIFKPFVGTGPKLRVIKNAFHKDYGVSCWFRTYAHIKFKYYENRFYKTDEKGRRRKIVPRNIHQMLTPRALAYWFMDDGSFSFWGTLYCLNTQSFTLSEQKNLVKALKSKFNLNFNVIKDRAYYRLALQEQDNKNFKQLIQPYIVPSFQYKLTNKTNEEFNIPYI